MLTFRTLGHLGLTQSDGTSIPVRRKDFALLVYLAVRAPRTVSRAEASTLFWGDRDSRAARLSLRQAIWRLRRQLDTLVQSSDDHIWLGRPVTVDALEIETSYARGDYPAVAALAQGDFLAGADDVGTVEFEYWLDEIRARIAVCAGVSLQRVVQAAFESGAFAAAASAAQRWTALAPLDEGAVLEYTRALRSLGRNAEASMVLAAFAERIETELGTPPSFEVRRIQADVNKHLVSFVASGDHSPSGLLAMYERARHGQFVAAQVLGEQRDAAIEVLLGTATVANGGALILRGATLPEILAPVRHARGLSGSSTPALACLASVLPSIRTRFPKLPVTFDMDLATSVCEIIGDVASEVTVIIVVDDADDITDEGADIVAALVSAAIPGVLLIASARERLSWLDADMIRLDAPPVRTSLSKRRRVFALVATALVAFFPASAGPAAPTSDSGTSSPTAQRFYQEGLHKYYSRDLDGASTLFEAALNEDSTFAMAAYFAGLVAQWPDQRNHFLTTARRLSERAPDRQRLIIGAAWSIDRADGRLRAIAETLATRFPRNPEGEMFLGYADWDRGDFPAAIPHYLRAVAIDSVSFGGTTGQCEACAAMERLSGMYRDLDSLSQAEKHAREWIRRQPRSVSAWENLGGTLEYRGMLEDALQAYERAEALQPDFFDVLGHRIEIALRRGDFMLADSMIGLKLASEDALTRSSGQTSRVMSLRMQGRMEEAFGLANVWRAGWKDPRDRLSNGLGSARILYEAGEYERALVLYDSVDALFLSEKPPREPFQMATLYAGVAAVKFALGDTSSLGSLEHKAHRYGMLDAKSRFRNQYLYVRGLRQRAQHDYANAVRSFEGARYSATNGNVRASLALAQTLTEAGRPAEAIPVLQAAIRGALGASGTHVTKTELHAALGDAFLAAHHADSAAAHYRWVVRAWANGEARFQRRSNEYQRRINSTVPPK